MSDWMKSIRKKAERRPNVIVIHGVEGSGKTSFAAQFPGATFMMSDNETGLITLASQGLVPECPHFPEFTRWADVMDATDQMIQSDNRPRTLVIDVVNGIEGLLHKYVCETQYNGEMGKKGFLNFQEGYRASIPIWRQWLAKLDSLRAKGTTIVLLCHTQVENFKNPEGADYHRYVAELHKETWASTKKFADMILFINFATDVTNVNKVTGTGKASGGQKLIYHCQRSAQWDAKNRHNLPTYFMGQGSAEKDFKEFCKLVKSGIKKQEPEPEPAVA